MSTEIFNTPNMGIVLVLTLGNKGILTQHENFVSAEVEFQSVACQVLVNIGFIHPKSLPFLVNLLAHSDIKRDKNGKMDYHPPVSKHDVPEHLQDMYKNGLAGMEAIVDEYSLADGLEEKTDELKAEVSNLKSKNSNNGRYKNPI